MDLRIRGIVVNIRSASAAAATAARRVLARSNRLSRLVWPSTDQALARRRDASIAAAAVFRAVTGRAPSAEERVDMLVRLREGLGVDGLVDELASSPEGAERITALASRATREQLDAHWGSDGGTLGVTGPRVVFLHIMKTGGTSLSEVLRRWAGDGQARVAIPLDDLVLLPRQELAGLRAVSGHVPYEALDLIPGPFLTVTVLRDPVSRTLSHYRELRRSEEPLRDLSLDEFLSSEVYDVPSGNYQARSLAHSIDLAGAWVDYSPGHLYRMAGGAPDQPYPLQALFDSTPIVMGDDQLLDRALCHLSRIDHVGVTEELDEMVSRLGCVLDLSDVSVPRLNASGTDEGLDLPVPVRRRIERRTEVDRELYETALKLSRG